jgi:hypothetical protein
MTGAPRDAPAHGHTAAPHGAGARAAAGLASGADNVHILRPSSAAPSDAGKNPAAAIPVAAAGTIIERERLNDDVPAWRKQAELHRSASAPGCGAGVLTFMAVAAASLILLSVVSFAHDTGHSRAPHTAGKVRP